MCGDKQKKFNWNKLDCKEILRKLGKYYLINEIDQKCEVFLLNRKIKSSLVRRKKRTFINKNQFSHFVVHHFMSNVAVASRRFEFDNNSVVFFFF